MFLGVQRTERSPVTSVPALLAWRGRRVPQLPLELPEAEAMATESYLSPTRPCHISNPHGVMSAGLCLAVPPKLRPTSQEQTLELDLDFRERRTN